MRAVKRRNPKSKRRNKMIFEFELVKIKHICDYTNILLVFENDHSTAERLVQEI